MGLRGWIKRKIDTVMRLMFTFLFSGALVIVMPACDRSDQQIKVYRLVKAPLESPLVEKGAPVNSAPPQIKWQLPDGWGNGSPSTMRYASFAAAEENGEKVDISVVTFPGDGGNRLVWPLWTMASSTPSSLLSRATKSIFQRLIWSAQIRGRSRPGCDAKVVAGSSSLPVQKMQSKRRSRSL